MGIWLFLAFVGVPILEIALFIQVGGWIGLWPTIAIVVLTALAGSFLMRREGSATLGQLRQSLAHGGDPSRPLAHGALILVAGVMLLTPGFFTDALGLALMIPPLRSVLIAYLSRRIGARMQVHQSGFAMHRQQSSPNSAPDIIDGEFEETAPPRQKDAPGSGWSRPPDTPRD